MKKNTMIRIANSILLILTICLMTTISVHAEGDLQPITDFGQTAIAKVLLLVVVALIGAAEIIFVRKNRKK